MKSEQFIWMAPFGLGKSFFFSLKFLELQKQKVNISQSQFLRQSKMSQTPNLRIPRFHFKVAAKHFTTLTIYNYIINVSHI